MIQGESNSQPQKVNVLNNGGVELEKDEKVGRAIAELVQSHDKLKKQLASANVKLEAIKKALPDARMLAYWGSGPKAFIEKVRSIIDATELATGVRT